jgi:hypothetical protein
MAKQTSKHTISDMNEGDIQLVTNDFGDYVLVRVAYNPGEYGYKYIDTEQTTKALNQHMENHNDMMQDAINDKTQDYINDNRTGMEGK